nr:molybdopterin-dependent oxidoreductase [Halostella sp. PRR32]
MEYPRLLGFAKTARWEAIAVLRTLPDAPILAVRFLTLRIADVRMDGDSRGSAAAAFRRLRPRPRTVDWSLFLVVAVEVVTGLVSFTVASTNWWPLFWLHRVVGLSLIVLLAFKFSRVAYRLTDSDEWRPSTALSLLTAAAALGAITTGVVWVFGLDVRLSYWTLLSVHVGFGLALVPLVLLHVRTRFRPPRRADFEGRRTALQYSAMLVGGAVVYRGQQAINRALKTPGSDRRFTGSQPRDGDGNEGFPVTSWVADDPAPVDRNAWSLSVRGEVEEAADLSYADLTPDAEREALLDCTSGWYTVQDWRGIRVGDLLGDAGPTDDAEYVRFVSVTGYRWSLPLAEARDALLATHVGGERLSHGHGGPLRLVAPGHRGFQWVKWVERVEVRQSGDPAQWIVTLISGLD